ncbi:glucans biosynthesis glucosyltransferase MdoH [Salipiger sp. IMCC34102]|uniref:glucans biosynthesis glucosyltransferase MdoH n=1 Tax=Salipiger sp. IMCC34102 TaxID=2510647 RepID=UPI00101C4349|nr:glucans biosynthesis glucosyltransferase MdoH [Salipiger sp. IMCC34102]RYH01408.1 glucans biosynthesis glucosyltransferase MdoH [Salipiger sp. IMCC34102]
MPDRDRHLDGGTVRICRILAIGAATLCALVAAATLAHAGPPSMVVWDTLRVALLLMTTAWLAWGAAQAVLGLRGLAPLSMPPARPGGPSPTAILIPICNEDPWAVRARIEAMRASVADAGIAPDFVILSDTAGTQDVTREQAVFAPLFARDGRAVVYYRNRKDRHGRKAGNVEDFIRRSGRAYVHVVILDADSLMDGRTIAHLIARMDADPSLGLLQTLPVIVGAQSIFGRAMQFAASFHSAVFSRGLARLQGDTGPFWGHNAIVRVEALSRCCGLPELQGLPPFGGTILSHDYVEAALLARGGWRVEMDPRIGGSYEEGPENLLAFARRDRRWCQGNLQHMRLLAAPGLKGWSRFVFAQGIASYLVALAWGAFLVVSFLSAQTVVGPDYFPEPRQLFPVFPDDRTHEIVALAVGIVGLLLLPKLAILIEATASGRAGAHGGWARSALSVLAETLLTALIAPVMLMYQTRAVLQVLSGQDGGWPATARGEGRLTLAEAWQAASWVTLSGIAMAVLTFWMAPDLVLWLLPVALPMIAAPLLIAVTSRPGAGGIFTVPEEIAPPPVVAAYRTLAMQTTPLRAVTDDELARPV